MPDLDIRGLLGELVQGGVDFLVIGGVAVGYHGHVRATKDVDVVPAPDSENLKKLARVLQRLDTKVVETTSSGRGFRRPQSKT